MNMLSDIPLLWLGLGSAFMGAQLVIAYRIGMCRGRVAGVRRCGQLLQLTIAEAKSEGLEDRFVVARVRGAAAGMLDWAGEPEGAK
jgi:hypothetical protein